MRLAAFFIGLALQAATYVDVAPIFQKHCVACHQPGQVAPFSLLTYEDAAKRAKQIAQVTQSGYMPPWKPVVGWGQFQHSRGLTLAEKYTLQQWALTGAQPGDLTKAPSIQPSESEWELGEPDAIVSYAGEIRVAATGPDEYRCLVLPSNLTKDRWVRAVQFKPGNARLSHHAILYIDTRGLARQKERGYSCFGAPGFLPTGALGGWSPGNGAYVMPANTAVRLRAGSDIVVQMHYHPTGKPEADAPRIALYFSNDAPTEQLWDLPLSSNRIDLPAGSPRTVVTDDITLPVAVRVLGIIPHAHFLAKQVKGEAFLPDGRVLRLLYINDWDFNWQDRYYYQKPLLLPAGTRVRMTWVYDNSAANPRNPHQPPQRVTWGWGVDQEMAGLHLQVLLTKESDAEEMRQLLWGRMQRARLGW